jgi:hypothetical protein
LRASADYVPEIDRMAAEVFRRAQAERLPLAFGTGADAFGDGG